MSTLRLALIQMQSKEGARDENVAKACEYIDEVAGEAPDLIVLPEFFNHEYVFQYRDYAHIDCAEPESGHTITAMREKAREHRTAICATIFEEQGPGVYFDTAFFIGPDGEIIGKYRKTHPAAVQSLEKIYFRGGSRFPVVNVKGFKVGAVIVRPLLLRDRPLLRRERRGADRRAVRRAELPHLGPSDDHARVGERRLPGAL